MLRSTITGSGPSGPPQPNVSEIINLFESSNISVIEETTALVRDSLSSTSESWLLNGIVDYYITSGNVLIRKLLTGIRQPQHKNLLAKLDEYLQKPSTRYVALNLFGHIVRKEPSWIHLVLQSRAFGTIIKCLQLDNDIAALTIAMYVLSTLLPKVPTQVAESLNHLFGIYVRLVSWKIVRKTDVCELNASNFDTALYSLFLCLYGMYPCSFLDYLQQYYRKTKGEDSKTGDLQIQVPATTSGEEQILMEKKRHEIFETSVLPMLQRVRLHPSLILYTKELEVLNVKWRKMESHDIVATISQIPIEDYDHRLSSTGAVSSKSTQIVPSEAATQSSATESIITTTTSSMMEPQTELMTIWSPSMEIGLSTPPPSRGMSPTREITDDKSRSDSVESHTKSKLRPSTLTLSYSPFRSNISTPCTPTMPLSYHEFEKSEDERGFMASEQSSSRLSLSGADSTSAGCSRGEFDFSACVSSSPAHPKSSAEPASITDFSPALQPSADHLTVSKSIEREAISTKDSLFIGTEAPTVRDILELASADLSREMSSDELMEKEIKFSIQSESQKRNTDIDWLHFGQGTLSEKDSQSLLAGYLQMHCAFLYEQHRRRLHATKARRLMRKIYESSALEERNKSLKENLAQKENEVSESQLMVKTLKADFSKQEKNQQSTLDSLKKESSHLSSALNTIREENIKLKMDKTKDTEALQRSMESEKKSQCELYKCRLELEAEARNKETNQELRNQIVQLQKEMLVIEELGRKTEALYENEMGFKTSKTAEYEMVIQSYRTENGKLKDELRKVKVRRDFMEGKAKDMEKMVEKKNMLLGEQKKYLENVKSLARSQIQAIDSKYQAQKSIAMRMEVQIMELYGKLTALEGQLRADETVSQAGSKPIQQPPRYKYGHLLEASPELSPPIKISMLDEPTVATSELEASTGME